MRLLSCLALLTLQIPLFAGSLHVDNVRGIDSNDGSSAAPVKTIQKGIDLAKPGDTVFLKVNPEPYSEPGINFKKGGAPGAPIVLDGQGATLSGLVQYGIEEWKPLEGASGVYGTRYDFPLRFKQVSATKDYEKSAFSIVFFDGKPGSCAQSLEALEPGQYFLSLETADSGGTLYIKLPEGRTLSDTQILMPRRAHTALHVGKSHVTVKNLTSAWASQDSFSTTKSSNLIFENVRGCYNMDQGMSHHGSQVMTRNSIFDHNGATGVRDVYDDCDSTYEDCVFFENLVAGVDAMGRSHRFIRCLFLDNFGSGLSVSKQVAAEVEDCTFKGAPERAGVRGWRCVFSVKNSSLEKLKTGISIAESKAVITGNVFRHCEVNEDWYFPEGWAANIAEGRLRSGENLFVGGVFKLSNKEPVVLWEAFVARTGQDASSRYIGAVSSSMELASGRIESEGRTFGSAIPAMLPEKYLQLSSPDPRVPQPPKPR